MVVVINGDIEGLRLNLGCHGGTSRFYGDVQQTLLIILVRDLGCLPCKGTLNFVKANRCFIVLGGTLR